MLFSFKKPVRTGPRPFPYAEHGVNRFGVSGFVDFKAEAQHIAIGRDGWAPLAYACALRRLSPDQHESSAISRYLDLANAMDGVAALEDWSTCEAPVKQAWLDQLSADQMLFKELKIPYDVHTGAMTALSNLLYALQPPHQGFILCCPQEFADWQGLPQHKAYRDALLARYNWVHEQVSKEFMDAGFIVNGPLFRAEGFIARYQDNWDIFYV